MSDGSGIRARGQHVTSCRELEASAEHCKAVPDERFWSREAGEHLLHEGDCKMDSWGFGVSHSRCGILSNYSRKLALDPEISCNNPASWMAYNTILLIIWKTLKLHNYLLYQFLSNFFNHHAAGHEVYCGGGASHVN